MTILLPAVVLAALSYWFHRRLVRATELPRPWSTIVDAVLVIGWALAVIGFSSGSELDPSWARIPAFIGMWWIGLGFYLSLGIIVIGLVSLASRGVGRLADTDPDKSAPRRLLGIRIATAALAVAAVTTTVFGTVTAASPQIVDQQIHLESLPAEFDGVRVALISDLHVGPSRGESLTRRVIDDVNAAEPDLVLLAGDLVDGTVDHVAADLAPLADLSAPLGVFAVSGNHEFYADDGGRWLATWDDLGVKVLRNERVEVIHDGAAIDVVGIQDATAPAPYEPDLDAALEGADPNRFTLLLAHQPKQAFGASDAGIDLQVSGHTHGGQIWPFGYLVRLQQPSITGLDRIGDTVLYTTRGTGTWGPPVRVGAPPEITLIELLRD